MSPSTRRTVMRVWMGLTALLFLARCSEQIRPYWKIFFGSSGRSEASEPALPVAHARDVPAPRTATLTSLRIATWNLEWLDLPGRGPQQRSRADYEALARYAKELDADLIAVEEAASEEALALVFPRDVYDFHLAAKGASQRTGFVYKKTLHARPYPDVDGLALHDLRAGADLGVEVLGRTLRLLAVHLKAFCVTGSLERGDDCQKLRAQLPALEQWIDARAKEGTPFVVLGDFNRSLSKEDAVLRELDDGDPKGLVLSVASSREQSACGSKKHREAIDHVLLGGASIQWFSRETLAEHRYREEDRKARMKLSDHCPLSLVLAPKG